MLNQRMYALYEDMGRVLERYFELPDGQEQQGIVDPTPNVEVPEPNPTPEDAQALHDDAKQVPRYLTVDDLRAAADRVRARKAQKLEEEAPEDIHVEPARPVKENPTTSDPGAGEVVAGQEEGPEDNEPVVDELTLRAIKAVYDNLKVTNPEYAARFKALPAKKMVQAVWKLVQ